MLHFISLQGGSFINPSNFKPNDNKRTGLPLVLLYSKLKGHGTFPEVQRVGLATQDNSTEQLLFHVSFIFITSHTKNLKNEKR